jgi:sugar lactone lactonase YvrE
MRQRVVLRVGRQLLGLFLPMLIGADLHAEIVAPGYRVERLVPPSAFHGVHGLAFDAQDRLHAGSVSGQSIYRVDRNSGHVETLVAPPEGMADDLIFLPDGTMVWTSISQNTVRARKGDEPVRVLAEKLPSVNSIAYRKTDGRLFVAQVFGGDGLWELDTTGVKPPRNILTDIGGLNGFDIGPDGWIYGPLWFKHQVVKINPDTGELKIISDDFKIPAAANFDSKWNLYVLDTAMGTVNRVDLASGKRTTVAQLQTALDNLAIDSKDHVFVSNMADNGIQEVDVKTGKARQVVKGWLANPRALAVATDDKRETLYVADQFAYRSVDGDTGRVTDLARVFAVDTKISYPGMVSVNADHVLLGNSNGVINKYERRSGKLLTELAGLRGAQNALELDDSSIVVAMRTGALLKIDANTAAVQAQIVDGLERPYGLAKASSSAVYVSEMQAGRIVRIELATGAKSVVCTGLKAPQAIALLPSGDIAVVETGLKRLVIVSPTSGAVTELANNLPIGALGENVAPLPIGLAIAPSGAIYVTSDVENSIYKLTLNRKF